MAGSEDPQRERKPAGCICTVKWTGNGENDFDWFYESQCPVKLHDHPLYNAFFQMVWNQGHGWGMAPSGGAITIDDGEVSRHEELLSMSVD